MDLEWVLNQSSSITFAGSSRLVSGNSFVFCLACQRAFSVMEAISSKWFPNLLFIIYYLYEPGSSWQIFQEMSETKTTHWTMTTIKCIWKVKEVKAEHSSSQLCKTPHIPYCQKEIMTMFLPSLLQESHRNHQMQIPPGPWKTILLDTITLDAPYSQ